MRPLPDRRTDRIALLKYHGNLPALHEMGSSGEPDRTGTDDRDWKFCDIVHSYSILPEISN
jgi:hypothetical protein